jgi:hypothetical protein
MDDEEGSPVHTFRSLLAFPGEVKSQPKNEDWELKGVGAERALVVR